MNARLCMTVRSLVAATALLVACGAPAPLPAAPSDITDALRDSVMSERRAGRFNHASRLADELVEALNADPASKSYEMTNAAWLATTVKTFAALPDAERARMTYVESWREEYHILFEQRKYDESAEIIELILDAQVKTLGYDHPETARSLYVLARVDAERGRLAEADSLYRLARYHQERTVGVTHPATAATLESHAVLLANTSRYARADSMCRRALGLRIDLFGASDPIVNSTLKTLADIQRAVGDVDAGKAYYREAIALRRAHASTSDVSLAMDLSELALLARETGDFAGALELYTEAVDRVERDHGRNHVYVGLILADMGPALIALGDYERAESIMERSLSILRRRIGEDNLRVAKTHHQLGALMLGLGRLEDADAHVSRAVSLYEKIPEAGHARIASGLSLYGLVMARKGRHGDAKRHVDRAADIYRKRGGEFDAGYARVLTRLAWVLTDEKKYGEARRVAKAACDAMDMSRHRGGWAADDVVLPQELSPYLLLALNALRLEEPAAAWRAIEREHVQSVRRLLDTRAFRELTPGEAQEERRLDAALERLETETASVNGSGAPGDTLIIRMLEAKNAWHAFQRRLAGTYVMSEGDPVDLSQLQARLPPNAAIVGWLDAGAEQFVYVVRAQGPVVWRALEPASPDVFADLLAALSRPEADAEALQRLSRAVYDQRFGPIDAILQTIGRMVVIPSGHMAGIPVEALAVGDDATLADRCEVSYSPSSTAWAWLDDRREAGVSFSMLALGDPPFNDEQARDMYAGFEGADPLSVRDAAWHEIYQRAAGGCSRDVTRLPRLGNRKEILKIAELFPVSSVLLGPQASERAIARIATGEELVRFRYLHLATYAFPNNAHAGESSLILSQAELPDILRAAATGERLVDGRITLEEIMEGWRLDANLVALSAGETVLSQPGAGSGYLGLAQGFFRAGARSTLLSLWRVADVPTELLMTRFYDNIVVRGMTQAAALNEAKRWLRDFRSAERIPYAHPAHWAAFILIGDAD